MADFCFDCVQRLDVPAELNDLRHSQPDAIVALCEGCGIGAFDHDGRRIDPALAHYGPAGLCDGMGV